MILYFIMNTVRRGKKAAAEGQTVLLFPGRDVDIMQ